jgi:hypothetical protein
MVRTVRGNGAMAKKVTRKPIETTPIEPDAMETTSTETSPMETQPDAAGRRNAATPMGSRPSKKSNTVRASTVPPANAEGARQSSLEKQRGQIAAVRKRRNSGRANPPGGKQDR